MATVWKQGRLRGPQLPKAGVDILCSTQFLKDRDQVQQLSVCHVIKPRLHGHLGWGKGSVSLPTASSSLPGPSPRRLAGSSWVVCSSGKAQVSTALPLPCTGIETPQSLHVGVSGPLTAFSGWKM